MKTLLALAIVLVAVQGFAAVRTVRVEDKTFTLEVNASAVKVNVDESSSPPGTYGVRSIQQSDYETYGIVPRSLGGGDEYWADSTIVSDMYDGSWKDKIWYDYASGTPKSFQMGGYTKRLYGPNNVYYIEMQFGYRVNLLKYATLPTQYMHTGSVGHRVGYSYNYPKDTEKSDSQTYEWSDSYSRLFKFFTGHAGYIHFQAGGTIYHDTHDKSQTKPDAYVRS